MKADSVTASAPGKVILFGEFAVLYGAPALVTAVDRRAWVQIEPSSQFLLSSYSHHDHVVAAPVQIKQNRYFLSKAQNLQFVGQIIEAVLADDCPKRKPLRPFHLHLNTQAFFTNHLDKPQKLGLGSSAALAVALVAALWAWLDDPRLSSQQAVNLALAQACLLAHRQAQQIEGSGIDVITSLAGGTQQLQGPNFSQKGAIRPVTLPSFPQFLIVWTGIAASTPVIVRQVQATLAADSILKAICLAEITASSVLAAQGSEYWWLAVERAYRGLTVLSEKTGTAIVSNIHQHICTIVKAAGGLYKPSGAGGGDIGLAFFNDNATKMRLHAAFVADNLMVLPLALHAKGLVVTAY